MLSANTIGPNYSHINAMASGLYRLPSIDISRRFYEELRRTARRQPKADPTTRLWIWHEGEVSNPLLLVLEASLHPVQLSYPHIFGGSYRIRTCGLLVKSEMPFSTWLTTQIWREVLELNQHGAFAHGLTGRCSTNEPTSQIYF